jgi:hypothetical protein
MIESITYEEGKKDRNSAEIASVVKSMGYVRVNWLHSSGEVVALAGASLVRTFFEEKKECTLWVACTRFRHRRLVGLVTSMLAC